MDWPRLLLLDEPTPGLAPKVVELTKTLRRSCSTSFAGDSKRFNVRREGCDGHLVFHRGNPTAYYAVPTPRGGGHGAQTCIKP